LGMVGGKAPVVFPLKDCFCFYLDVFTENCPPKITHPTSHPPTHHHDTGKGSAAQRGAAAGPTRAGTFPRLDVSK